MCTLRPSTRQLRNFISDLDLSRRRRKVQMTLTTGDATFYLILACNQTGRSDSSCSAMLMQRALPRWCRGQRAHCAAASSTVTQGSSLASTYWDCQQTRIASTATRGSTALQIQVAISALWHALQSSITAAWAVSDMQQLVGVAKSCHSSGFNNTSAAALLIACGLAIWSPI